MLGIGAGTARLSIDEKVLPAFSFMTPAKFKSMTVEHIAKAMIATALHAPAKSNVYRYPEMVALGQ